MYVIIICVNLVWNLHATPDTFAFSLELNPCVVREG